MVIAVIDTNIFINSLLKGSCRLIIQAFIAKRFRLATSKSLINEIVEVCAKRKFRERINKEDRETLIAIIKEAGEIVNPKIKITDCRDKDDNKVLECAIASKAQVIVTRDTDLLVLNPYKNVSIIPPEKFIPFLKNNE
ncbi:MAG: putative toxin-antitoxin system toxin component, PIN family [Chlamydiae bacterium]|nr:putative toxin-antitoxin system toxin component, PIN family [Chlamydiota bacterium]MBI3277207.1 putative toxin-antitoxin system toxin component, PIN family [Chlamydiota bacterium]